MSEDVLQSMGTDLAYAFFLCAESRHSRNEGKGCER